MLECTSQCDAITTKSNLLAILTTDHVEVYNKDSFELIHTIELGDACSSVNSIAFGDGEAIRLVSDYGSCSIRVYSLKGEHLLTLDQGNKTFEPDGIAVSPDGLIYVCGGGSYSVCVFSAKGKFMFSFGSCVPAPDNRQFDCPRHLCFANNGFLYITDQNNKIHTYDKDGKFVRIFSTIYEPWCIGATDCGHLIVSSWTSNKVMIYTTGGDLVHVFGECGSELGEFQYPSGVSVDSDGLIYIADFDNNRIQVF